MSSHFNIQDKLQNQLDRIHNHYKSSETENHIDDNNNTNNNGKEQSPKAYLQKLYLVNKKLCDLNITEDSITWTLVSKQQQASLSKGSKIKRLPIDHLIGIKTRFPDENVERNSNNKESDKTTTKRDGTQVGEATSCRKKSPKLVLFYCKPRTNTTKSKLRLKGLVIRLPKSCGICDTFTSASSQPTRDKATTRDLLALGHLFKSKIDEFRSSRPKRLLVFVNPFGGKGKALQLYKGIVAPILELAKIDVKLGVTKYANHARETIEDPELKLDEYDGIVCVGGDGMFAEIMNGVLFRCNKSRLDEFGIKSEKFISGRAKTTSKDQKKTNKANNLKSKANFKKTATNKSINSDINIKSKQMITIHSGGASADFLTKRRPSNQPFVNVINIRRGSSARRNSNTNINIGNIHARFSTSCRNNSKRMRRLKRNCYSYDQLDGDTNGRRDDHQQDSVDNASFVSAEEDLDLVYSSGQASTCSRSVDEYDTSADHLEARQSASKSTTMTSSSSTSKHQSGSSQSTLPSKYDPNNNNNDRYDTISCRRDDNNNNNHVIKGPHDNNKPVTSFVDKLRESLGGVGHPFKSPQIPIGVIGAGSTDANSFGFIGTNDAITATLNIIMGNQIDIDVCSIHSFEDDTLLRFVSTFVAYGYFGDVTRESEKFRWLGPSRYDLTGFNNLIKNRSYRGKVRMVVSSKDGSPNDSDRCHMDCPKCLANISNSLQYRDLEVNDEWLQRRQRSIEELKLSVIEKKGSFIGVNAAVIACRCPQTKKGFAPSNHLANGCADLILVRPCTRLQYLHFLLRTGWTKKSAFDLDYVEAYRCRQFEFIAESDWSYQNDGADISHESKGIADLESYCLESEDSQYSSSSVGSTSTSGKLSGTKSMPACGAQSTWNLDGETMNVQSIRVKVNNQLLRVFGTGEPESKS